MGDVERVWLVERTYGDKGLVTLVYATPEGDRHVRMQRAAATVGDVTAAREVEPERLVETEEADDRERYAREAARVSDRHAPDDTV